MKHDPKDIGGFRKVTLCRTFAPRSLASQIRDEICKAVQGKVCFLLLDLCDLRIIRPSEISALIEFSAQHVKMLNVGVLVRPSVASKFATCAAQRVLQVFSSELEINAASKVLSAQTRDIQTVLLAGSCAPLLGPMVQDVPAALLQVGGKTLLERKLTALSAAGVQSVKICVGDRAEMVRDVALAKAPGHMQLSFVQTKGALSGPQYFSKAFNQAYLNGFGLWRSTLLIDVLAPDQISLSELLVTFLSDPNRSVVSMCENDLVAAIIEKNALGVASSFAKMNDQNPLKKTARAVGENALYQKSEIPTLGTALGYAMAQFENSNHIDFGLKGYNLRPEGGWVHKSARVASDVCIPEGSVIGPGTRIGRGVRLQSCVLTGSGASVAENAVLQDCLILEKAHVPRGTWANKMIVGRDWSVNYPTAKTLPIRWDPLFDDAAEGARSQTIELAKIA